MSEINDPESAAAAKDAAQMTAPEPQELRPRTEFGAAQSGRTTRIKQAVRNLSETVTDPRPATRTTTGRKVRLALTRIDPWSVMKIAFVLSVALGIVMIVAVSIVWAVLDAAGVWGSINDSVSNILGSETGDSFDVANYVGPSRVIGLTIVIALLDVVLLTALATLSAFLYNMAAALVGGVRVTLTDRR